MRIQITCQKCGTALSVKSSKAGQSVTCPTCSNTISVPIVSNDLIFENSTKENNNDDIFNNSSSSLKTFFTVCISTIAICLGMTIVFFVVKYYMIGVFLLFVTLLLSLIVAKLGFNFFTARATAIRTGRREIDLFFGFTKLVLWEENEGLLFLKNKRIDSLIYGPDDGGGMKFIYPILGEEIKVHVPLTLQMCEFQDHKVLTRESIQH